MTNIINNKLKIHAIVAFVAIFLLLTLPISAKTDRVVDNLDVLSESEESALEAKLDSLSAEYGHDIAVVTVGDLNGKDINLYTRDFFELMDYGMGDSDSGIVLLIYINESNNSDRQYALTLHGEADKIFTESDLSSLEDAFWDHLADDEYIEAFDAYADKCAHIIKYDNRLTPIWIVISLVIGAIAAGITVYVMCSKYKGVRAQRSANTYMQRDTFHLDRSRDVYLYSHVSRRLKPQNNGSSSGGGRSSSGRSYGGRSGRF